MYLWTFLLVTNDNPGQNILPHFKIAVKWKESSFCPEILDNKTRNSLEIIVTCVQRFKMVFQEFCQKTSNITSLLN